MTGIVHYTLDKLIPYVNWAYFFHAWGVKREETDQTKRDALNLAQKIATQHAAHASFGLWRARSLGDDIVLESGERLHFLRQQQPSSDEMPCLCLADFINEDLPKEGESFPVENAIGAFAATVDEELLHFDTKDSYEKLLLQTLCDRIAEAAAEKLHEYVRKEAWGYAKDEALSKEELFKERFQGIRPAVGYPSLPDQSIIFEINNIMPLQSIGIEVTENGAMRPHASVAGLMLGRKEAKYFHIGEIGFDQLQDYAKRKGMPIKELKKFLQPNLSKHP